MIVMDRLRKIIMDLLIPVLFLVAILSPPFVETLHAPLNTTRVFTAQPPPSFQKQISLGAKKSKVFSFSGGSNAGVAPSLVTKPKPLQTKTWNVRNSYQIQPQGVFPSIQQRKSSVPPSFQRKIQSNQFMSQAFNRNALLQTGNSGFPPKRPFPMTTPVPTPSPDAVGGVQFNFKREQARQARLARMRATSPKPTMKQVKSIPVNQKNTKTSTFNRFNRFNRFGNSRMKNQYKEPAPTPKKEYVSGNGVQYTDLSKIASDGSYMGNQDPLYVYSTTTAPPPTYPPTQAPYRQPNRNNYQNNYYRTTTYGYQYYQTTNNYNYDPYYQGQYQGNYQGSNSQYQGNNAQYQGNNPPYQGNYQGYGTTTPYYDQGYQNQGQYNQGYPQNQAGYQYTTPPYYPPNQGYQNNYGPPQGETNQQNAYSGNQTSYQNYNYQGQNTQYQPPAAGQGPNDQYQPPPPGQAPNTQYQPPPPGQPPNTQYQPPPPGQPPNTQYQPPPQGQNTQYQAPPPGKAPNGQYQPPPQGSNTQYQPPPQGQAPNNQYQPPPQGQGSNQYQPPLQGQNAQYQPAGQAPPPQYGQPPPYPQGQGPPPAQGQPPFQDQQGGPPYNPPIQQNYQQQSNATANQPYQYQPGQGYNDNYIAPSNEGSSPSKKQKWIRIDNLMTTIKPPTNERWVQVGSIKPTWTTQSTLTVKQNKKKQDSSTKTPPNVAGWGDPAPYPNDINSEIIGDNLLDSPLDVTKTIEKINKSFTSKAIDTITSKPVSDKPVRGDIQIENKKEKILEVKTDKVVTKTEAKITETKSLKSDKTSTNTKETKVSKEKTVKEINSKDTKLVPEKTGKKGAGNEENTKVSEKSKTKKTTPVVSAKTTPKPKTTSTTTTTPKPTTTTTPKPTTSTPKPTTTTPKPTTSTPKPTTTTPKPTTTTPKPTTTTPKPTTTTPKPTPTTTRKPTSTPKPTTRAPTTTMRKKTTTLPPKKETEAHTKRTMEVHSKAQVEGVQIKTGKGESTKINIEASRAENLIHNMITGKASVSTKTDTVVNTKISDKKDLKKSLSNIKQNKKVHTEMINTLDSSEAKRPMKSQQIKSKIDNQSNLIANTEILDKNSKSESVIKQMSSSNMLTKNNEIFGTKPVLSQYVNKDDIKAAKLKETELLANQVNALSSSQNKLTGRNNVVMMDADLVRSFVKLIEHFTTLTQPLATARQKILNANESKPDDSKYVSDRKTSSTGKKTMIGKTDSKMPGIQSTRKQTTKTADRSRSRLPSSEFIQELASGSSTPTNMQVIRLSKMEREAQSDYAQRLEKTTMNQLRSQYRSDFEKKLNIQNQNPFQYKPPVLFASQNIPSNKDNYLPPKDGIERMQLNVKSSSVPESLDNVLPLPEVITAPPIPLDLDLLSAQFVFPNDAKNNENYLYPTETRTPIEARVMPALPTTTPDIFLALGDTGHFQSNDLFNFQTERAKSVEENLLNKKSNRQINFSSGPSPAFQHIDTIQTETIYTLDGKPIRTRSKKKHSFQTNPIEARMRNKILHDKMVNEASKRFSGLPNFSSEKVPINPVNVFGELKNMKAGMVTIDKNVLPTLPPTFENTSNFKQKGRKEKYVNTKHKQIYAEENKSIYDVPRRNPKVNVMTKKGPRSSIIRKNDRQEAMLPNYQAIGVATTPHRKPNLKQSSIPMNPFNHQASINIHTMDVEKIDASKLHIPLPPPNKYPKVKPVQQHASSNSVQYGITGEMSNVHPSFNQEVVNRRNSVKTNKPGQFPRQVLTPQIAESSKTQMDKSELSKAQFHKGNNVQSLVNQKIFQSDFQNMFNTGSEPGILQKEQTTLKPPDLLQNVNSMTDMNMFGRTNSYELPSSNFNLVNAVSGVQSGLNNALITAQETIPNQKTIENLMNIMSSQQNTEKTVLYNGNNMDTMNENFIGNYDTNFDYAYYTEQLQNNASRVQDTIDKTFLPKLTTRNVNKSPAMIKISSRGKSSVGKSDKMSDKITLSRQVDRRINRMKKIGKKNESQFLVVPGNKNTPNRHKNKVFLYKNGLRNHEGQVKKFEYIDQSKISIKNQPNNQVNVERPEKENQKKVIIKHDRGPVILKKTLVKKIKYVKRKDNVPPQQKPITTTSHLNTERKVSKSKVAKGTENLVLKSNLKIKEGKMPTQFQMQKNKAIEATQDVKTITTQVNFNETVLNSEKAVEIQSSKSPLEIIEEAKKPSTSLLQKFEQMKYLINLIEVAEKEKREHQETETFPKETRQNATSGEQINKLKDLKQLQPMEKVSVLAIKSVDKKEQGKQKTKLDKKQELINNDTQKELFKTSSSNIGVSAKSQTTTTSKEHEIQSTKKQSKTKMLRKYKMSIPTFGKRREISNYLSNQKSMPTFHLPKKTSTESTKKQNSNDTTTKKMTNQFKKSPPTTVENVQTKVKTVRGDIEVSKHVGKQKQSPAIRKAKKENVKKYKNISTSTRNKILSDHIIKKQTKVSTMKKKSLLTSREIEKVNVQNGNKNLQRGSSNKMDKKTITNGNQNVTLSRKISLERNSQIRQLKLPKILKQSTTFSGMKTRLSKSTFSAKEKGNVRTPQFSTKKNPSKQREAKIAVREPSITMKNQSLKIRDKAKQTTVKPVTENKRNTKLKSKIGVMISSKAEKKDQGKITTVKPRIESKQNTRMKSKSGVMLSSKAKNKDQGKLSTFNPRIENKRNTMLKGKIGVMISGRAKTKGQEKWTTVKPRTEKKQNTKLKSKIGVIFSSKENKDQRRLSTFKPRIENKQSAKFKSKIGVMFSSKAKKKDQGNPSTFIPRIENKQNTGLKSKTGVMFSSKEAKKQSLKKTKLSFSNIRTTNEKHTSKSLVSNEANTFSIKNNLVTKSNSNDKVFPDTKKMQTNSLKRMTDKQTSKKILTNKRNRFSNKNKIEKSKPSDKVLPVTRETKAYSLKNRTDDQSRTVIDRNKSRIITRPAISPSLSNNKFSVKSVNKMKARNNTVSFNSRLKVISPRRNKNKIRKLPIIKTQSTKIKNDKVSIKNKKINEIKNKLGSPSPQPKRKKIKKIKFIFKNTKKSSSRRTPGPQKIMKFPKLVREKTATKSRSVNPSRELTTEENQLLLTQNNSLIHSVEPSNRHILVKILQYLYSNSTSPISLDTIKHEILSTTSKEQQIIIFDILAAYLGGTPPDNSYLVGKTNRTRVNNEPPRNVHIQQKPVPKDSHRFGKWPDYKGKQQRITPSPIDPRQLKSIGTTIFPNDLTTIPTYPPTKSFWDNLFNFTPTTPFPGNKPGTCPTAFALMFDCHGACSHDSHCYGRQKCCHDGRGTGCCANPETMDVGFNNLLMPFMMAEGQGQGGQNQNGRFFGELLTRKKK